MCFLLLVNGPHAVYLSPGCSRGISDKNISPKNKIYYPYFSLFNIIANSFWQFSTYFMSIINIYSNNLSTRINTSGLKQFLPIIIFIYTRLIILVFYITF